MEDYGLDHSQVEKLRHFQEVTSIADQDMAMCTLASLDWNLERAIETHLTAGDDDDVVVVQPEVQFLEPDDDDDQVQVLGAIEPRVQPYRAARPTRPLRDTRTNQFQDENDPTYAPQPASVFAVPHPPAPRHFVDPHEEARMARPSSSSSSLNGGRSGAGASAEGVESDNDMVMSDDDYAIGHDDADVLAESSKNVNASLPLIPMDSTSVEESLQNFVIVFEDRFAKQAGCVMPNFYTGSLVEAVREAFEAPGRGVEERRPLALYIHNDKSIAANIFPSMVLCKDEVTSLLRCQYVLWPWDVTHRENEQKLKEWLQLLGIQEVRQTIDMFSRHTERFPLLVLLTREKGTYNLVNMCTGGDSVQLVLQKLMNGVEAFTDIRMTEANEKRDREERERIRQEQAMEYEMSLAADKARMETKEREARELLEEEQRRRKAEEDEQFNRAQLASQLPDEPAEGSPGAILVKFRLPEGEQCMRRFRNTETLSVLLNYLAAKGYSTAQFRLFNSDFPKKDVSSWNADSSFLDLKWPVREQIFVEEN